MNIGETLYKLWVKENKFGNWEIHETRAYAMTINEYVYGRAWADQEQADEVIEIIKSLPRNSYGNVDIGDVMRIAEERGVF